VDCNICRQTSGPGRSRQCCGLHSQVIWGSRAFRHAGLRWSGPRKANFQTMVSGSWIWSLLGHADAPVFLDQTPKMHRKKMTVMILVKGGAPSSSGTGTGFCPGASGQQCIPSHIVFSRNLVRAVCCLARPLKPGATLGACFPGDSLLIANWTTLVCTDQACQWEEAVGCGFAPGMACEGARTGYYDRGTS